MRILKHMTVILIVLFVLVGLGVYFIPSVQSLIYPEITRIKSPAFQKPVDQRTVADWIVIGAKEEVIERVTYDASYQPISYPDGDVDPKVGACTDVVIRALRKAGYDLQQLIHEDMQANFEIYPNRWGATQPDSNIDHRRVPNQLVFFERYGIVLPTEYTEETKTTWQPGDIVYWKMSTGADHTGVISDLKNYNGVPLVIHNAFRTIEDDALLRWNIIGHVRFPKSK